MKSLSELQELCRSCDIAVSSGPRAAKQPYLYALQQHYWKRDSPGQPLPPQIRPMLLSDWNDLDEFTRHQLEADMHEWIVQEKKDGVRVLFHIAEQGIRITGRNLSESTFRLLEYQDNLPHLCIGLDDLKGTILDGELVCPASEVDTGKTVTTSSLQATVAMLATNPQHAATIQRGEANKLRLYVFDILKLSGRAVTDLNLDQRLSVLAQTQYRIHNPYIEFVPGYSINKSHLHESILASGGEGTVWKKLDQPYEIGRRVSHWIKRKREIVVEAFVSGFKLGTTGRGNENLVGAVEFSIMNRSGQAQPIAWVSRWTDEERARMTWKDQKGIPTLNPTLFHRRAMITGQDITGRSQRIRHARLKAWLV